MIRRRHDIKYQYILKHYFDDMELYEVLFATDYLGDLHYDVELIFGDKYYSTKRTLKTFVDSVLDKTFADGKIYYEKLNYEELQERYPECLL